MIEREGKILTWSWREYLRDVEALAKAMHTIGISERKSVNIMGHNAPEWVISFIAGVSYNCHVSGVYPTNNAEACYY